MPEDVDAHMLDPEVRRELRSLTRESADLVARHLVMTGRLLDEDPDRALAHARAARAMAGRVGVVREAAGLAAYASGEWTEALAELRAARRITGRPEHLAVLADCERALGRPERALAYADDLAVAGLSQDERVELVIVLSGARRDLGQPEAAVLALQDPARRTGASRPWAARLWYAYGDALLSAGRADEARSWFEKVVGVDAEGETDAGDRLLELDGVVLQDLPEDESDERGMPDDELAAFVAEAFPRASPETTAAAPEAGSVGAGSVGAALADPSPSAGDDRGSAGDSAAVDTGGHVDQAPGEQSAALDAGGTRAGSASDAARLPEGAAPAAVPLSPEPEDAPPSPASARSTSSLMPLFASPCEPDAGPDKGSGD